MSVFRWLIDLNQEPIFCGCGYIDKNQLICEHMVAACYSSGDFAALEAQERFFKNETAREAQAREYTPSKGTKKNESQRRGTDLTRQNPLHAVEMRPRR